jgi:hypothetical protein
MSNRFGLLDNRFVVLLIGPAQFMGLGTAPDVAEELGLIEILPLAGSTK